MTQNELAFWRIVCAQAYARAEQAFPPGPEYDGQRGVALLHAGTVADRAVKTLRTVREYHVTFGTEDHIPAGG